MTDLTAKEKADVRALASTFLSGAPPIIGVVGLSGVGKSTTINKLFSTTLPVSHTKACTKELTTVEFSLRLLEGPAKSEQVSLRVVDAPGLGESLLTDPDYLAMYDKNLTECDAVLWVISARNRALALDQTYLNRYMRFSEKIVFGLNQIDLVHPSNWRAEINLPSQEMKQSIAEIVSDRKAKLAEVLRFEPEIVPYSAERGFGLQTLFTRLLRRVPRNRRWIYSGLKAFNYRDFYPLITTKDLEL